MPKDDVTSGPERPEPARRPDVSGRDRAVELVPVPTVVVSAAPSRRVRASTVRGAGSSGAGAPAAAKDPAPQSSAGRVESEAVALAGDGGGGGGGSGIGGGGGNGAGPADEGGPGTSNLSSSEAGDPSGLEAEQPRGSEAEQPRGSDAEEPSGAEVRDPGDGSVANLSDSEAEQPRGSDAEQPPGSETRDSEGTPFGPDGHPRRWTILGVLVVGLLIVVLDNTVLNIALPTIQRDLHASQSELLWAVDSYILAFAATLFTWGTLGDRFGRRKILLLGLVLFAIGSVLSSTAPDPGLLITYRVLMGVGGAAVMPVTLAIITVVFPRRERGRAIGAWAGAVGGAMALGPVVGGLLLQNPGLFRWLIGNDWGSVFLINVPVVAAGVIGVVRVVPETRDPRPKGLDLSGLVVSVAGLILLVYGIVHASDTKDWLAPSVLGPMAAGAAVLGYFVVHERRSTRRSFDVALFAHRGFSVSLASISLTFFALSGILFAMPFYLQILRGQSTLEAGASFVPFAVGQLLAAPRSAAMVERFGTRIVMTTGMLGVVALLAGLSAARLGTPMWLILGELFLLGLAMGNVIAPGSTVIQNTIPLDRTGAGSAVQNTVRQVCGALGVAIIGTLLSNQYSDRLSGTLSQLPPRFPAAGREALSSSVAAVPQVLARGAGVHLTPQGATVIRAGAFDAYLGAQQIALLTSASVVLCAALIVLVLLPRRTGRPRPIAGGPRAGRTRPATGASQVAETPRAAETSPVAGTSRSAASRRHQRPRRNG